MRPRLPARQPAWASGLRYRIVEQLGQGAHGTVWLARRRRHRDLVAVKRFDSGRADSEAFMRFVQEQHMRLDDPHVVASREWVQDAHRSLLVMDYVHGPDLQHVIDADIALSPQVCADFASQLLAGVAHIHRLGIVHRDIKPSNVMVDVTDLRPQLKLADFGSALLLDGPRLTSTGGQVGTVPYIAPETVAMGEHDEASDLYAVGMVVRDLVARCSEPAQVVDDLVAALTRREPLSRPRSADEARRMVAPSTDAPDTAVEAELRRLAGPYPRPPIVGVGTLAIVVVIAVLAVVFAKNRLDAAAFDRSVDRPLGGATAQINPTAVTGRTATLALPDTVEPTSLDGATVVQCRYQPPFDGLADCDRDTEQPLPTGARPTVSIARSIRPPAGTTDCAAAESGCVLVVSSEGRDDLIWTQLDFGS
ncbi:MAG: serine/threonine-protein kinase [Acidimicrobiales bacterium]